MDLALGHDMLQDGSGDFDERFYVRFGYPERCLLLLEVVLQVLILGVDLR